MKPKIIIFLIIFFLSISAYTQDKTYNKEKKEIIELIHEETRHFLDRNFEGWAECWLHEPWCRHYFMGKDFCNTYDGWNEMVEGFERHFQGKKMENFVIQKCDFDIKIFEKTAFAHFTEKYITTTDEDISVGTGKNNVVFIKENGDWKFVTMNIAYVSNYERDN